MFVFLFTEPRQLLHNTADRAETVFGHLNEHDKVQTRPPRYRHMFRIGKTKLASEKGLFDHICRNSECCLKQQLLISAIWGSEILLHPGELKCFVNRI